MLIGGVRVTCCDASGTQLLPPNVLLSHAHILKPRIDVDVGHYSTSSGLDHCISTSFAEPHAAQEQLLPCWADDLNSTVLLKQYGCGMMMGSVVLGMQEEQKRVSCHFQT